MKENVSGFSPATDAYDVSLADYPDPQLLTRPEKGRDIPLLLWRLPQPMLAVSTASAGGGWGERQWVINAHVADDYDGADVPGHARRLAAAVGAQGPGSVMLTAAKVERMTSAAAAGIRVDATVGISTPTWAAVSEQEWDISQIGQPRGDVYRPGTINMVVRLTQRLTDAALLGALGTVTEAKTQALIDAGVPGTGTPTDAITLLCTTTGDLEVYAGTRSAVGAALARATYQAVRAGVRAWR